MENHSYTAGLVAFRPSFFKTILLKWKRFGSGKRNSLRKLIIRTNYFLLPFLTNGMKVQSGELRKKLDMLQNEYHALGGDIHAGA